MHIASYKRKFQKLGVNLKRYVFGVFGNVINVSIHNLDVCQERYRTLRLYHNDWPCPVS